ncbi:hypothetical protein FGLOB1_5354 [Fusarium globosum]|uniref:GATA-type domain-containing protein n=1 Tax=Fusarium globosum TaxID=78864 RepID=A0A8H5YEF4_9HYPO|nr:hypothetical protein FGLOB1_5354 [Fusarium globosum]
MTRRSARLASRQSGDATAMPASLSETPNELGEPSSAYPNPPQEWDDDDDDDYEYEDDRDTVEYTQRRRETAARAVATPASSKKIHSVEVTHEGSESGLSESEEDEEFLVENDVGQECLDLSELPLDPSEAPPEEPEGEEDDDELETHRSNKRARISIDTAEQWISDFNQANPVNDDDPDVQRFRETMKLIVEIICNWARQNENGSLTAWFKLPASERETTSQFRSVLAHVDIQELIDNIFEHIPNKVQKLLGKQDLRPIDLLDLPHVPHSFAHRLTYADIAVRAGVSNITHSPGVTGKPVKSIKPDADLESLIEAKVYVGSTICKLGGYSRIRNHELGSDGKKGESSHYNYTKQPDVAPNFRIIGVWSNPLVVESLNNTNDIQRWLPVFLEGILMVYLGLLDRSSKPVVDVSIQALFAESKYVLIDRLRSNLELPDFHNQSLNKAWPLAQGVRGGMIIVNECSNPACRRPKIFNGKKQIFYTRKGKLSERLCKTCHDNHSRTGKLRTSNRYNYNKSQGPRVCSNPNCGAVEGKGAPGKFKHDKFDETKWICNNCWMWQHVHNENRPARPPLADIPTHERTCCNPNCGKTQLPDGPKVVWTRTLTATGTQEWRCNRCHLFLKSHGIERPTDEELKNMNLSKVGRSCLNCGRVHEKGKNAHWAANLAAPGTFRCGKCASYHKKHQEERPQHLWNQ